MLDVLRVKKFNSKGKEKNNDSREQSYPDTIHNYPYTFSSSPVRVAAAEWTFSWLKNVQQENSENCTIYF